MANKKANSTLAGRIVTDSFANIGEKPKWWEFVDQSTSQKARVDATPLPNQRIRLQLAVGNRGADNLLEVHEINNPEAGGTLHEYTLLETTLIGTPSMKLTWQGGVKIPALWDVGNSVSATSNEPNPVTGNRVQMTITLKKEGPFEQPYPIFEGIRVEASFKDISLGNSLGKADLYFMVSRGITYAQGQAFGVFFVLAPKAWYGEQGS